MNDAGPIYSIVAGKKNGSSLLLIVCKAHRWVKGYKKMRGGNGKNHKHITNDLKIVPFVVLTQPVKSDNY